MKNGYYGLIFWIFGIVAIVAVVWGAYVLIGDNFDFAFGSDDGNEEVVVDEGNNNDNVDNDDGQGNIPPDEAFYIG